MDEPHPIGPAASAEGLVAMTELEQVHDESMRALLRAHLSIAGDLALPTVLRRVTEAACSLAEAPYGALGVISPDGTALEQFVHVGVGVEVLERIGHLPRGEGLLGALIHDPAPIRLAELASDPRSTGFPAGHPTMRAFLGVPVRIRDEVYGNLYLARPDATPFSAEQEHVVAALAATAAVAIDNARLYDRARRREATLVSTAEVTQHLLTEDALSALPLIAARALDLVDADFVGLVVPDGEPGAEDSAVLRIAVAVGRGESLAGTTFQREGSVSGAVMATGEPSLLTGDEAVADPLRAQWRSMGLGPAMVLPLVGSRGVRGSLVVGRLHGRGRFIEAELTTGLTFAGQATVALELAEARLQEQRVALLEERARIGRDLHDHVIQQLFAAGMTLEGVAASLDQQPAAAALLERVVGNLDEGIRQIRASIFQLAPPAGAGRGLRTALLRVVDESARALGFEPSLGFDGPVDALSDTGLNADVGAVVREALSNVARHAQASAVSVEVEARPGLMRVVVADDGATTGEVEARGGLHNLRLRAEARGGSLSVRARAPHGTEVEWSVPL